MSAEDEIIKYVFELSGGKFDLDFYQARKIVRIASGTNGKPSGAYALLYKVDPQTTKETLCRTIKVTNEQITDAITKALKLGPVKDFYLYKCYNSEHEYEGCIYSENPNIF